MTVIPHALEIYKFIFIYFMYWKTILIELKVLLDIPFYCIKKISDLGRMGGRVGARGDFSHEQLLTIITYLYGALPPLHICNIRVTFAYK